MLWDVIALIRSVMGNQHQREIITQKRHCYFQQEINFYYYISPLSPFLWETEAQRFLQKVHYSKNVALEGLMLPDFDPDF